MIEQGWYVEQSILHITNRTGFSFFEAKQAKNPASNIQYQLSPISIY